MFVCKDFFFLFECMYQINVIKCAYYLCLPIALGVASGIHISFSVHSCFVSFKTAIMHVLSLFVALKLSTVSDGPPSPWPGDIRGYKMSDSVQLTLWRSDHPA